jgi:hypothetical protein
MIPAATETWKVKCGRNFEQDIPDPGALFSLLANPLTAGGPKPFKGGEPKEGVWKVAETPCDLGEGPAPPVAPESAPWKMKVEKSSRKGMRELTAMLETIQDVKQDVANGWVVGLTAPGYAAEADNATIENFSWMRLANPRADVVLTGGLKGQCLRVRLVKLRLRPVQIFLAREIENDLCQRNRVRAHEIEHFNRMSAHSREFLSDARSQVTKLLSNGQMLPRASFPIYIETGKAEEVLHQFGALIVQNLLLEVSRSVADEQVAWDKADKIVKGGICDPWPQPQIPWLRPP